MNNIRMDNTSFPRLFSLSSLLAAYICLWGLFSEIRAEDLVSETYLGVSEKKNPLKAKKEISKEAIKYYSIKYIRQIVGDSFGEGDFSLVKARVINQSGKYIPFINGRNFIAIENGFEMSVDIKLSLKNLREVLLAGGFLEKSEGSPKILPIITFEDGVNESRWNWWNANLGKHSYIYDYALGLDNALREASFQKGFYSIPVIEYNLQSSLPDLLVRRALRKESFLDMALFFGTDLVLQGRVNIIQGQEKKGSFDIRFDLEGIHSMSHKVVASFERSYTTDIGSFHQVVPEKLLEVYPKVMSSLLDQLHEALKSGVFGAKVLKITLEGRLSYQQLVQFKDLLKKEVHGVKEVRARRFEPSMVIFEIGVDSGESYQNLAKSLSQVNSPQMKFEVIRVGGDGIGLRIFE